MTCGTQVGPAAAAEPCPVLLGWWRDPGEDQTIHKLGTCGIPTALPSVAGRGTRTEVGDILKAAATRAGGLGTPICSSGPRGGRPGPAGSKY